MTPEKTANYIISNCAAATGDKRGRVLLISYKFPPHDVGVAQHRPEALYRHLREFGWDCDVITAERPGTPVDVIQTPDRSWTRSVREEGSREAVLKQTLLRGSRTGLGPFRQKLIGNLKLLMRLLPKWHDEFAGWSYGIEQTVLATARERGSTILWATCSPYTLAPVAVRCARQLGIPCVIDLRDPLPDYLHFPRSPRHWFYRALAKADTISLAAPCCITPELLAVRSSSRRPDPVLVVSGSWQDTKVPPRRCDIFRLMHAGILVNGGRSPQPLFEAVAMLRGRYPDMQEHLRMTFIGSDSHIVRDFPGYAAVQDLVEVLGQMPYSEVQEKMATSSMLLIIKLDGDIYSDALPAKMYDYLPYEAPVLSFGMSPGLQGPLLEWSNAGRWIGSAADIADYIEEQYLTWLRDGVVRRIRRPEAIEYLGQRRMAGEFASLFQVTANDKPIDNRNMLPWQEAEEVV